MNRMNRREFISVLGGVSAFSMAIPALASSTTATTADKVAADLTSFYVKGLVMVDLSNPDIIRLGFPHQWVNKKPILTLQRQLRDLFMRPMHRIARLKSDN